MGVNWKSSRLNSPSSRSDGRRSRPAHKRHADAVWLCVQCLLSARHLSPKTGQTPIFFQFFPKACLYKPDLF